jgi:sec-independent protein translocase protein TatA
MNISTLMDSAATLAFGFAGGWEILVFGGIALLLFGNRLPGAAKSLGMSFSAFKKGIKEGEDDETDPPGPGVESPSPPAKG